jgi:hypothetical protein
MRNMQVGVLIGKAGETIKNLQMSSGAKIQITKDVDADSTALTRPVELVGSLESIDKAEQLIKSVIAEVYKNILCRFCQHTLPFDPCIHLSALIFSRMHRLRLVVPLP